MNNASEIFSNKAVNHFNCAQAVAAGSGREDLVQELSCCGGGKAPEGHCGALHAALMLVPESVRETAKNDFAAAAGSLFCRDIKAAGSISCAECVAAAAGIVEKYHRP